MTVRRGWWTGGWEGQGIEGKEGVGDGGWEGQGREGKEGTGRRKGQGLEGKEVDDHETFLCSYIILVSLLCDLVVVSPAWSLVDICIDLLHRLASSMWPR